MRLDNPRVVARAAAVLLSVALSSSVRAFPTGSQFDSDPVIGAGGGGISYTGAPDFAMATCASCHTDGALQLGVKLEADDETLFSGGYRPGAVYQLQVVLINEMLGAEWNGPKRCGSIARQGFVPCNSNGFGLDADDPIGGRAGLLCGERPGPGGTCASSPSDATVLSMDGVSIHSAGYFQANPGAGLPGGYENGVTAWRFFWLAPAAGTGPVTFHIGAVDGNGGEATADVPQDTLNDDTAQAHVTVAELNGAPLPYATSGCSVAPTSRGLGVLGLLIAMALGLLIMLRFRRKHRTREGLR